MKNKLFDFVPYFGKNKIISLSLSQLPLLILTLLSIFTLSYCAKDTALQSISSDAKINVLSIDRQAQMDELIEMAKAGNQGSISVRTNYSITDAIDLLDETLNYNYCRPGVTREGRRIVADTLLLPVSSSNTVSSTDIATALTEAANAIGNQYHALSLTNKTPWAFSVKQFGNRQGNYLPLFVTLSIAHGTQITSAFNPTGNTDGYEYSRKDGLCNTSSDDGIADGAPEIIRNSLKFNKIQNNSNQLKYFHKKYAVGVCRTASVSQCGGDGIEDKDTPDVAYENVVNPSDPTPVDNINDYLIFRQFNGLNIPNYDLCLTANTEIAYVLVSSSNLIDTYQPSTHVIGDILIGNTLLLGSEALHNMITEYFKVELVNTNATQLPCPSCGL